MALKHMFSGLAGIPGFVGGAAAKNYGGVTKRANKWFDYTKDGQARFAETQRFKTQMANNTNLSESEAKWMAGGYWLRNIIGSAGERTANDLGGVASIIGGTVGYGAKKAAVGSAKLAGAAAVGTGKLAGKAAVGTGRAAINEAGNMQKRWANSRASRAANAESRQARNELIGKAGKATFNDAKEITRGLYNAVNTKTFAVAGAVVAGSAIVGSNDRMDRFGSPLGDGVAGHLVGSADGPIDNIYESGMKQGKGYHTMQQVAANMSVSYNGGGAFLNDIAPPAAPVDDFGATGDLVFALHSLRNGG